VPAVLGQRPGTFEIEAAVPAVSATAKLSNTRRKTMSKEKNVTRRDFIKGTVAAGAGVAAAGALAGAKQASAAPAPQWDKEADVVVVGGGGTGLTAAVSAAEAGAKVVVLEFAPFLGGTSTLCVGSVTAPFSQMQKKLGVQDSLDSYTHDILHMTGRDANRMDMTLLRWLGENGGPTIDWLAGHGVQFAGPFEYPEHKFNRMHMLVPNAYAWPKTLAPVMKRLGVEILLETKGLELVADADRQVIGVKAMDQLRKKPLAIKARRGVVLAAGDFIGNTEMRLKYMPKELADMHPANTYTDGSGLLMAMAVGADLTVLDDPGWPVLRSTLPGPNVMSTAKQGWMPYGIPDAGAILVNKQGKRYVNEKLPMRDMCVATDKQPGKVCFMVFDEKVATIFNKYPMVVSSIPAKGWGMVDDFVARNGIKKADTIEGLAQAMGIDPAGLKEQVAKWNGYCAEKKDPDFGRPTFGVPQANTVGAGIQAPPFYCHGPIRTEIILGNVSTVVNAKMQVIDVFGKPIPRLYAGGNMGHGLTFLSGHGTHMAWAFTSGRFAGMNAAAEKPAT
jgi:fumarate reductase flavoprotein subunit